ncbi:MAG: hypothetical protein B6U78_01825 [Candidatus Aenigmarchaeota archaeon ex4484_224]|nr:MAG: hypothetical protein B6U78_01825 [Candidatus Aenigmarchaeota archaeon ex4484_224]
MEILGFSNFQSFLYYFFLPWIFWFLIIWILLEKTKILGKDEVAKRSNKIISIFLSFLFVVGLNFTGLAKNFIIGISILPFLVFLTFFVYYSLKFSSERGSLSVQTEKDIIKQFREVVKKLEKMEEREKNLKNALSLFSEIERRGLKKEIENTEEYKKFMELLKGEKK